MEVVEDLAGFGPPPGGSAVTIGAYDGVHVGHQQLLARLRAVAAERSCATAVVTFDRHPALVVRPDSAPKLLTDLETKLDLLAATGIDYTVVVHFDEARSREPAADFVRTVLVRCLDARVVAVGRDFHFGHNREGNVEFLERLGPDLGFAVLPVDLFDDGHGGAVKVSSTRVRTALAAGDVATASALLGRPHLVRGPIVRAEGGPVPAVTVAVAAEICLPAAGLYAGWFRGPDGARAAAAISVDTPADAPSEVDVYLLGPGGAGRGARAIVEFTARLADHDSADGRAALTGWVGREAEAIRAALR